MNTVKVKREELLTKVRANRDAHRELATFAMVLSGCLVKTSSEVLLLSPLCFKLFIKAQEGYRKLVIGELDRMLADAREGRPIQRSVTLTEPSNHIKDYDRVITMLEMSVDETIVLDASEFDHYVMDSWDWSRFAHWTNTAYAGATPCAPGPFRS